MAIFFKGSIFNVQLFQTLKTIWFNNCNIIFHCISKISCLHFVPVKKRMSFMIYHWLEGPFNVWHDDY